jgi:hypothetical protein
MNINITKTSIKIALLMSLIITGANAIENNTSTTGSSRVNIVKSDKVKLINIAGKQRMLSQRIAKDYIYQGKKIATGKASKQLKASLGEFSKAHKHLLSSINDPEILNLLAFVEMSNEEFTTIVNQPFNLDNAQLALDLSESMLEGSQYVVDSLTDVLEHKESDIVAKSGKQRMLAQRIAKYYISYQAGIKDKNSVYQMEEAVKTFSLNLNSLMKNSTNTPKINQKLNEVNKLWKIVYKFYLKIEKGGLPFIVFTTTDDITKKMDEITKLYVDIYK